MKSLFMCVNTCTPTHTFLSMLDETVATEGIVEFSTCASETFVVDDDAAAVLISSHVALFPLPPLVFE